MKYAGPRMPVYVKDLRDLILRSGGSRVIVHCWRGRYAFRLNGVALQDLRYRRRAG